jgi:hypothetical protein
VDTVKQQDFTKFMPIFMSKVQIQNSSSHFEELFQQYKEHAVRFAETLGNLSAKKILKFKSAKIPPSTTEKNIGIILMTLQAAFVDSSIRLTNDKTSLFDKSWTTGVLPYF